MAIFCKIAIRCHFNMAKKIFARASLSKGTRWVIDYTVFDSDTGEESRHRRDFRLNEIDDLTVREAVAARIIANIEIFAAKPVSRRKKVDDPASPARAIITVETAVRAAVALKLKSPRVNTHKSYKSIPLKFLYWASKEGLSSQPVSDFGRRHARAFMAWLQSSRKYRGCTLNNYVTHLKALWTEMIADEIILENVWKHIKPYREETKLRRIFSEQERQAVAKEIERTDYWLFRGLLLQFFCYVRPVELTRLHFRDFDFAQGTVTVQEQDEKKWKKVVKTIPKDVMHYFTDGRFNRYPDGLFVFGRKTVGPRQTRMEPSTIAIDEDRMYKRHLKVLNRLKKRGQLKDITGLHWYSWKDTGISLHTRNTSPVATKDQAGHTDLSTTSLYYTPAEVNAEYRDLKNDLF